jgi:hypothetical protein
VDAGIKSKLTNQMARDYVINSRQHSISTSSFAVVHQISKPLNSHAVADGHNGRYDYLWNGGGASARLKAFRKQHDAYLYKRYDKN